MNSIYKMFNDEYLRQQAEQEKHQEQVENVGKSIQKLKDFLDSLDDIKPEYRTHASTVFSAMIINYFCSRHNT